MIKQAQENKMGWEYQFLDFFEDRFREFKKYDEFDILYFNKADYRSKFVNRYNDIKTVVTKTIVPDRHKEIAMLTKAFLDVSPFFTDTVKASVNMKQGKTIPRFVIYPNECIAIAICEVILTHNGRLLYNDANYCFSFPDKIYVHVDKEVSTNYEYELFMLYRHYLTSKNRYNEEFSIYQMSNLYFSLEMAYDISTKPLVGLYYNP
ncbi:MAG: hypothetical protein LBR68_01160 [Lachnoclostridium sp.]|nr:hypothetical protein [Lachnoclostridium sp.]